MPDEIPTNTPQDPASDLQLERFLELSADPVVVVDVEGRIVAINQLAEDLFGFAPDELRGKSLGILLPGRFRGAHEQHLREYFRDPGTRPMGPDWELWARRKDGSELPVEISLHPLEENASTFVVGSIRDVTLKHRKAKQLRDAYDEIQSLKNRLEAENVYLQEEIRVAAHSDEIVGDSAAWRAVMSQVALVAGTQSSVLLMGETGTGKEVIARAVHAQSDRCGRPLIKVDCATLPATLIESELFGHEKGAFSGAITRRKGRFELADGGMVFLDEIGDLPLELQAKLLRVLQDREFERLGSSKTIEVDIRVISATNRDLKRAVQQGSFRSDLYYRLAVFPIEVPPLRLRGDDIPLLADYFLSRHAAKQGKEIDGIPQAQMDALVSYSWPGNVRELENLIERAVIISRGPALLLEPFPATVDIVGMHGFAVDAGSGSADESTRASAAGSMRGEAGGGATLVEIERAHILAVLGASGWKVKGKGNAAERLGLKESTLRARMKKLGIRRPRDTD